MPISTKLSRARSATDASASPTSIARAARLVLGLALVASPSPLAAQARTFDSTAASYASVVANWIVLPAAPGAERFATDRITAAADGFRRDALGNLVRRTGSGTPRRVIACGLDEPGYVVSEIDDNGYLRLHGTGNVRQHPLWDQFHEGQRIHVAAHGEGAQHFVPGVVGVRSTHLWRRRATDDSVPTVDDLWVDVGARSRGEVARLGIRLLDPVQREWPQWTYGDWVAGPGAANRAGCAAVVAASQAAAPSAGETDWIVSVQSRFGWTGLSAAIASLGSVDTLVIVDAALARNGLTAAPPAASPFRELSRLQIATILALAPRTRFSGALVESVRSGDIAELFTRVARLGAVPPGGVPPAPVRLARTWSAPPPAVLRDSLSRVADLLGRLADVYSVSGHEDAMRAAVREALPAWARDSLVTDSAGNLVLGMGPDRDTTLFVAHLDEIGFEITHVARDGTVSLRTRGGFFPSLWEGQTALLHRPDDQLPPRDARGCGAARATNGPLRGVFIPRDSAVRRTPAAVTAWFGLDSAALDAAGVRAGMVLTSYKCSARLAATRFTARSIDDRAGSTALIVALDSIDRKKLTHRVLFAWSVREETGLDGAAALGASLGTTVKRVYAIDTFVSSDSPLESRRFADAPLGGGAVARALDNSSVTPADEVDRVVARARAARIPLQVGTTNGGNDGSAVARYGAVDVPIGWPLRYSHSPAEVIDLRDLRSLSRIIAALARE